MSKKSMMVLKYIMNILVFIILFVALIYAINNAIKSTKKSEKSLSDLSDAFQNLEPNKGKVVPLSLDQKAMIIGFNPEKNTTLVVNKKTIASLVESPNTVYIVERPAECFNEKTCVCMCGDAEFDNSFEANEISTQNNIAPGLSFAKYKTKLECDPLVCKNYENFTFKSKMMFNEIVDKEQFLLYNYQQDYISNGFFIIRSDEKEFGYSNLWGEYLDVQVKKSSSKEVSVCFKEKCT